MTRTILYTAYDRKYAGLANLTMPRMMACATLHGFTFDFCNSIDHIDIPDGVHKPDAIYWVKFIAALNELRSGQYERFIWLDVDQMITNFDYEIPRTSAGFYVPKDWGNDATEPWHFSVCAFVAHGDSIPLFEEAIALAPEYAGKPFPEQEPMRQVIKRRTDHVALVKSGQAHVGDFPTPAAAINLLPRKPFNSVPEMVCPGRVPEPWKRGEFMAHLTMLPIEDRIKLFHQIRKAIA